MRYEVEKIDSKGERRKHFPTLGRAQQSFFQTVRMNRDNPEVEVALHDLQEGITLQSNKTPTDELLKAQGVQNA